jgi:alpha-1,3-glucosyltransferase
MTNPPKDKVTLPLDYFLEHPEKFLPPLLIICTCFKILLMPTYRSTDFDVHRNWLAITHQLPLSEWYFDNVNGTTVHTLDYPPAFAYFEWILSNNPITQYVLPANDRCLDLLPDSDNTPSDACVIFQRSTVIISDLVLWMGAYTACRAMYAGSKAYSTMSFLLIAFNPGLLWLDHIHFQYNGMLLGILLGSLGLLMHGNNLPPSSDKKSSWAYHIYHLGGAALYALLLNLKHLYLPLAPLYFCYLLKKYCLTQHNKNHRLVVGNFWLLAGVTAGTLVGPWIPFLLQEHPKEQLLQIVSRLFPFGRGLVHDYWAANIWALYTLADKIFRFLASRIPGGLFPVNSHLPEPSPLVCALLLLISLLPGLKMVFFGRCKITNVKLMQAVVYSSFCTFMLAYHVHEKAILTTLLPLTLLVNKKGGQHHNVHNFLFDQVALWGLLGLFPLFFEPVELAFKLVSYFGYLTMCWLFLSTPTPSWTRPYLLVSGVIVKAVICLLELLPIQGRWEFLPLMVTSISCAVGLVGCCVLSLWLLLNEDEVQVA